jgi:hypothetical protein
MKKLLAFIILSVAMVSCYDNYIVDYPFTGIYFPYQQDVRTFVVGEGMKIEVGAALGGVRHNLVDRDVSFTLNSALINPATLAKMQTASQTYIKDATLTVAALQQLPANYYTISNSGTFVIKAGQHMGSVIIKPDSLKFVQDSVKTILASYALPFYITAADADSIIEPKRYNVIGVKFEHMLYGTYWHGGAAVVNRPAFGTNPAKPDTTYKYSTTIPVSEGKMWKLMTAGPSSLNLYGYLDVVSTKPEMKLVLKNNTIFVSTIAGSTYVVTSDGSSSFNRPILLQDRKIFLKYKFTNTTNGYVYRCTDTLTFRNRIRDGVSEWQDENPAHYLK